MRVLHVTRDFAPRNAGGVSTAVSGLVKALSDAGVPQAVVSFDAWQATSARYEAPTREDFGGVPVLRSTTTLVDMDLRPFVEAFAPTIEVVYDPLVASHTASYVRPRVQVVHVLASEQDRLRNAAPTMTATAQADTLPRADRVVTTTRAARSALLAALPDLRVDVCGLAPSLAPHASTPAPPRDAIVAALRFDWLKGVDVLLDALPRLRGPIIIAGGLPESPKTERRWRQKLEAAGAECVGWLSAPSLAALLERAAVFIAPSRLETCGMAVLEAAAAGAPLVVSDIAAHREVVPDAETFASGDSAGLVAAVERALAAPRAASVPSWSARVHEWLAFFADCR